ncbi:protein DENND6B isoform X8 [Callorhinus ursinus]|uniref:Protein DENND6B isoform X5 n=1 Tax=Callorhinus ursinus TaxID=34884 RepID=A0A3Q7PUV4_CALUR|nr:protein DENND6B isoform X5 [Callorhinus ursinus]XP_025738002.1 protein DENND6B isoform X6 [Callorhinus ursinus]
MDPLSGAGPRRARGRLGAAAPGARAAAAPWARFSAWLECVCVVTFDLELGQALELVYPSDFRLTDKEKSSICYLSFPDSHSGCLGDTQFSFRIRQCGRQKSPWHAEDWHYNSGAPVSLQREPAHYFGYVYFRQVKDSSVKRGYFQKSLVLVSRLPFVRLFQALLSLIAPEYFDKLAPCLEAVCSEIDQWPAPVPGQTLNLPVMGVVLQVRAGRRGREGARFTETPTPIWQLLPFALQVHVPSRVDRPEHSPPKQCSHENLLPAPVVLTSVHELDLFRCFQPVLTHVQTLWELMLLGEPLVVLAPSPAMSSEMVLALISCLQPLKFCCDYRPYFTIHDSEFKEFTTRTQAPPNVVLGVTNPFFIKTLQHWPHILRVGEPKMSGDLPKQVKLKKPSRLKTLDTKPGVCPLGRNPSSPPEPRQWALSSQGTFSASPGWRPLHHVLGPPPPGQGTAQAAAQGAAEEEALGHTDSTAEKAPPGAHAELHHPPGALHGQPHAPAEEHHTLEGPCLRLLPRSALSARMTSCVAWSTQGPSSPASSRATGWASTGGFSNPPTLTAGTGSGTKRWPRSWRPCTLRLSVRRTSRLG